LARRSDGNLADLSSFPLIKALWKSTHQTKFRYQNDFLLILTGLIGTSAGFDQRLLLCLDEDVVVLAIVFDNVDVLIAMGKLIGLKGHVED
jgi:hypothetical protein